MHGEVVRILSLTVVTTNGPTRISLEYRKSQDICRRKSERKLLGSQTTLSSYMLFSLRAYDRALIFFLENKTKDFRKQFSRAPDHQVVLQPCVRSGFIGQSMHAPIFDDPFKAAGVMWEDQHIVKRFGKSALMGTTFSLLVSSRSSQSRLSRSLNAKLVLHTLFMLQLFSLKWSFSVSHWQQICLCRGPFCMHYIWWSR